MEQTILSGRKRSLEETRARRMASQLWSNYDSRYVADYDNDDESGADGVWESSSEENDEDDDSDDDSWIVPDDEVEDESDNLTESFFLLNLICS